MDYLPFLGLFIICLVANTSVAADVGDNSCASPSFFKTFMTQEATKDDFNVIDQDGAQLVRAVLHINVHSADCGSADSYGNDIVVKIGVRREGTKCIVGSVNVTNHLWGDESKESMSKTIKNYENAIFIPESHNINLNEVGLKKLVFRNNKFKQALYFSHDKYFFFDDLPSRAELIPELESGESQTNGVFGFSYNLLFK